MMRQPARLAGLSGLQDFLERGFAAFRSMGGAEEFLRTIDARETQIMEAIILHQMVTKAEAREKALAAARTASVTERYASFC